MSGYYKRLVAKAAIGWAAKNIKWRHIRSGFVGYSHTKGVFPTEGNRTYTNYPEDNPYLYAKAPKYTAMLPYRARRRRGSKRGYGRRRRRRVFRRGYNRTGGFYGFGGRSGLRPEYKFFDRDIDAIIPSTAVIFTDSLNRIAQGTGESARVGRKCTLRSLACKLRARLPILTNSAAPTGDSLRIVVYLDKQCNGATAQVLDVLETADVHSFRNLANISRFSVLYDRVYPLSRTAASGADATAEWAPYVIEDSFFKKFTIPIEFSGTTGTIAEIRSNNIGIIAVTQFGKADLDLHTRLRFSG